MGGNIEIWNPIKVKYDVVCDTKEQFELFADFMKAMKDLKENKNVTIKPLSLKTKKQF